MGYIHMLRILLISYFFDEVKNCIEIRFSYLWTPHN